MNTTTNTTSTDPILRYVLNIHSSKYKHAAQAQQSNHESIASQTDGFSRTNTLTGDNIKVSLKKTNSKQQAPKLSTTDTLLSSWH